MAVEEARVAKEITKAEIAEAQAREERAALVKSTSITGKQHAIAWLIGLTFAVVYDQYTIHYRIIEILIKIKKLRLMINT